MKKLFLIVGILAILTAGPVGAADILLMLDDIAAGDQDTYRTALTASGVTWDEWDLDSLAFPTAGELAPYTVLIWADESTLGPGDTECQIVADWLGLAGKRLFATSVDFLWDLENGTPGNGEHNLFLLLETSFTGDYAGTGITQLDGVASDPIGGDWSATGMGLAGSSDSNGDYSDGSGSATSGLIYGAGDTGSGFAALTHYDSGTYRTVWLGVNFHNGLTSQTDRDTLMTNIMTFFEPIPVELMRFEVE